MLKQLNKGLLPGGVNCQGVTPWPGINSCASNLTKDYYQAVSKRNSLAGYLYLRLFNEVLMCANKSLIGGKEQEVSDDLCLSLDIVDGYGIKFVYMYFVSINYIYIVKDEMFIRTCFVTPCFFEPSKP